MKKSLLLFSTCLSINVQAQTVILEESLKDRFPESTEIISTIPQELDGWEFNRCFGQKEPLDNPVSTIFVQVGSSSNAGSIITKQLAGLTGNALISANICPKDNFTLNVEVIGEGALSQSGGIYTTGAWQRSSPILMKNANSATKLKFAPTESGQKRFFIANIKVTDIDDAIFYESFNRCDSTGGNDGNYSVHGDAFSENDDKNWNKFDYCSFRNKVIRYCFVADKCIHITDNGHFRLPSLLLSTNNCVLSFKAAGNSNNNNITISYKDKTTETEKSFSRSIPNGSWQEYQVALGNVNPKYSISFSGSFFYLDEIKVVEIKELGIDEAATDVSAITEKMGKYVDAQLTRTFKKNIWNTCCLPFTVRASYFKEVAGDDLEISILKLHDITADGVFNFEDADEVAAGEPFLLQVNKDITNPLFTRVKITADAGATKTDANATGYAFKGILCKTALNTDHTDVFLGTDEELHYPTTSGNLMRGMRAYFTIPEGANINATRIAIIDSTEGISEQPAVQPNSPIYYYNMKGQQVQHPTKGFYIVRSADGRQQSKKVLVK